MLLITLLIKIIIIHSLIIVGEKEYPKKFLEYFVLFLKLSTINTNPPLPSRVFVFLTALVSVSLSISPLEVV